jgi:hypothetical protein
MRTIVDIQPEKLAAIALICQHYKMSRAELIRQSIDNFLKTHYLSEKNAFGILKGKHQIDGLVYQRRVRSEWVDK